MGQQQLLLIILGVIVVGIAFAVGITMFQDNTRDANRDAVTSDLDNLAARAQQYYRRPTALGGGQGSFDGLTISRLTSKPTNENGSYMLTGVRATQCTLLGTGIAIGNDGASPVRISATVLSSGAQFVVEN